MRTSSKIRFFLLFILCACIVFAVPAQDKKNGRCKITESNGNVSQGKKKRGLKTGAWKTYSGKNLIEVTVYKRGLKDGPSFTYHKNSAVQSRGMYVNDKRNGTWYHFFSDGDTSKTVNYRNDTLHGYFCQYAEYKKVRVEQGYYTNGEKNSLWIRQTSGDGSGESIDSTWYVHGKREGRYVRWKEGYLIETCAYSDGRITGLRITYFPKSKQREEIAWYMNGKQDGEALYYFPSGKKRKVSWFQEGKHVRYDSTWTENPHELASVIIYSAPDQKQTETLWRPRSVPEKIITYYGLSNIPDSMVSYFANGQYLNRMIYMGPALNYAMRTGVYTDTWYYPNGKMRRTGKKTPERGIGKWTFWDSTGHVQKEITYPTTDNDGFYINYYPDGLVRARGNLRNGRVDSLQIFTMKGAEVKSGTPEYERILADVRMNEIDVQIYDPNEPEPMVVEMEDSPPEIFTFPEQMPMFPGDSMQAFIQHNVHYPQMEKEQGKQGVVYVHFIVEKDGTLSDVRAVKEVPGAPGLTKEAIRVIKRMPRWKPALMNGRPVRCEMTLPIRFRLE